MLHDRAAEADRLAAAAGVESTYLADFLDSVSVTVFDEPVADVVQLAGWVSRANQAFGGGS